MSLFISGSIDVAVKNYSGGSACGLKMPFSDSPFFFECQKRKPPFIFFKT